jgi:16S rRNA (uracil1498-N3)-methyltransferase
MAIPRVFWKTPLVVGQQVPLQNETAHHLLTVLRLKTGEDVYLFNGESEFLATLNITGKRSAELTVVNMTGAQRESALQLELATCLYRGKQFDAAIQKAVELGVQAITPVISHKSDVIQNTKAIEKRTQHLQKIIVAACEQSGRIKVPHLRQEISLPTWVNQSIEGGAIACDFSAGTLDWLNKPTDAQAVSLLIGPMGGFTEDESQSLATANIPNLHLGPRTLRSDTATTVALGLIQHHWGDLS